MFANRYFAPRYFAPRYFPPVSASVVVEPPIEPPVTPTTSSSRGSGPTNGIQSIGYHKHHEADLLQTRRNRILREDEDIMAFIISFVTKGPE
jgi:hypothetical protein